MIDLDYSCHDVDTFAYGIKFKYLDMEPSLNFKCNGYDANDLISYFSYGDSSMYRELIRGGQYGK